MKLSKILLTSIILIVLCISLTACEFKRDYGDGTKAEEVGFWGKTSDIFFGKPIRKIIDKKILTGDPEKDKEIAKYNTEIQKHNEGAKKDREEPDEGLMPFLEWAGGAGGLGGIALLIRKIALQRKREEKITVERDEVRAGYQEIKETYRGDNEKLEKIKVLFNEGKKNLKLLADGKLPENIEHFKGMYNNIRKKG